MPKITQESHADENSSMAHTVQSNLSQIALSPVPVVICGIKKKKIGDGAGEGTTEGTEE